MITDQQYVDAARRIYDDEGTCEVDEYDPAHSIVSRCSEAEGGDNGAYVQAWVWVEDAEAEKENAEESQQS